MEVADVIVVGSPAYRATYTGLFTLFFDHVGQRTLPVIESHLAPRSSDSRGLEFARPDVF